MGLLNDIAALAKAGYSVAEVKELMSLASGQAENQIQLNQTQPEQEKSKSPDQRDPDPQPETKDQSVQTAPLGSEEPAETPSSNQSGDQLEKIAELEKQLAAAQAVNRTLDISKKQLTDEDRVKDLVLSFM